MSSVLVLAVVSSLFFFVLFRYFSMWRSISAIFMTLMPSRLAVLSMSLVVKPFDAFSKIDCVRLIKLLREPMLSALGLVFDDESALAVASRFEIT